MTCGRLSNIIYYLTVHFRSGHHSFGMCTAGWWQRLQLDAATWKCLCTWSQQKRNHPKSLLNDIRNVSHDLGFQANTAKNTV